MSTASSFGSTAVRAVRTGLLVSGVISLVVGLLILIWPGRAAEVVVAIISIYVILAGVVNIALAIFSRARGWARIGYLALGVLFLVAGVIAFSNLGAATAWFGTFVGVLVGILWIIEGVVSLTTVSDTSSRAWTVFFAVVSIIAGVILLFAPLLGVVTLFLLIGFSLVVLGLFQIVRAIRFGRAV
ncbi:HdeD family acid-resistance protein [Microbacterium sp. LMI1-1-1.1]|uniref:HdeD family acid-resistance protein n=1 Tax=unclassified Microbacterium TaxID=2609290 RepID=UPI0034670241